MAPALAAMAIVLALLTPATPAGAALPVIPGEPGLAKALAAANTLTSDGRRPVRQARPPARPIDLGKDGRFTILLIGSDWRRLAGGERLDSLLVMSIDPLTGRAAAVGIPRDMVSIPLAGGGDSGGMRINAIYFIRYRDPDLPHAAVDRRAVNRFTRDIERLLGTDIDAWALMRFGDFAEAITALDGIRIDNRQAIIDTGYHSGGASGVYFPAARGYRLKGDPVCRPYPRACRSALAYVRSRKGTVGDGANSDYRRAARAPRVVMAAVRRVVEDKGAGLLMLALLAKLRRRVWTSLPTTPAAVAQLYDMLRDAKLPPRSVEVLSPGRWAYTDASTAQYTYRPNLPAIRKWVDRAFYRVGQPRERAAPAGRGAASPTP